MVNPSEDSKAQNPDEETLALRDASGNLYLVATKNLVLHQVASDKASGAEKLISNASKGSYEVVGTLKLPRLDRRAVYATPIIDVVLNIPSPTS